MLWKNLKKKMAAVGIVATATVPAAAYAAPVDFSAAGGLGVSPADVVATGFNFASLFNDYTTLVLGILFAPVMVGFVIWVVRKIPRLGSRRD